MSFATVAAGAGVRTIGVAIRGDATSLTSTLARSARDIRTFETQAAGSASRFAGAWKVGIAAVTVTLLALVTGLTGAGLAAAGFESRMRNVNTLVRESDAGLAAISRSVLDLSTQLPTGANDLAEGLYQVASSGFAGSEGLIVLDKAARAASAGLSTTEQSVTAITAVLNAYGLSAASAGDVSDVLFQTVNLGVVEFSDLTGVIGDVVGMAAAAKVPIEDVGAAIATMTLSGVSANEAGTSLNRLLQQLIQPSDALAAAYRQLGYESGAAALESKGLAGVMEDLRQATGGSVEAYLRLFPEVRGARGAFALAANEGETYARVMAGVAGETERTGATQRALDEQMQSTSLQWTRFTNTLTADAIDLGGRVLPAFTSVLSVLQSLAEGAVPALNRGLEITKPLWDTLAQVGGNIVEILGTLLDVAVPIGKAMAGIAAGATLAALNVLATSLEAITGFLADHPALVVTVAALWASRYLPSVTAVAQGLQRFTLQAKASAASAVSMITEQIRYQQVLHQGAVFNGTATGQLSRFSAAMSAARTSAAGLGRAFVTSGLATAGLTIGIMAVVNAATTGADEVKSAVAELTAGVTDFSGPQVTEAVDKLRSIRDEYDALAAQHSGMSWDRNLITAYSDYDAIIATNDAMAELNDKAANTTFNLLELRRATGLSVDELARLQMAQGVDLTSAVNTESAKAGRDLLIAYIHDIERQTGLSTDLINDAVGGSLDQWEAFGKAIEDATGKARQAATAALDVIGTWKPNIGVQEEADAIANLAEARERLREVEATEGASASSMRSARQSVADAESRLADAQAQKAEGTLEAFYQRAINLGEGFSRNLNTAVEMGLDPTVVAKLLQQGPEQAGPILEQLVGDHSGRLIEMVNASEAAIAEITGQITEQARLTAMAVNSTTDDLSRDLPTALNISTMAWQGNSARDIAEKLGLDSDEVERIAREFGITLAQAMQMGFDDNKPILTPDYGGGFVNRTPGKDNTTPWFHYATGGIYPGYTPGRDIGYVGVSGGEAIMRPEWTRAVGAGFVHRMNSLAMAGGVEAVRRAMAPFLGGFANGGIAAAYSGGPTVVTVPIRTTNERYMPVTIQHATFTDPDAAGTYAQRVRARSSWTGGRRHG